MFYTNRIFSKLHTKCEKDLKSAEMTTNKCVVHGKVTETNLVKKKTQNILGEKIKGTDKKWNAQKDNFKICKMSMGGNDTHKKIGKNIQS